MQPLRAHTTVVAEPSVCGHFYKYTPDARTRQRGRRLMRRRLGLGLPCEINVSTPVATVQTYPVRLRRRRRMRVDTRADECGRPKTVGHGAEDVRHELAVATAVAVDVRGTRAGRLPLLAVAPAVPISLGLQVRGPF